jgi:hypothetical protein
MSQGAKNNSGQGSRPTFVSFTKAAAVRINDAVLTVEKGNRTHPGLTFDHPQFGGNAATIRSATFTGSWSIGGVKNVTYKYMTGTANATNDLMNLPSAGTRNCVIGREGTAWRLINWQWDVNYAVTDVNLTTAALQFTTKPFGAVSTATQSFSVSVATCATA